MFAVLAVLMGITAFAAPASADNERNGTFPNDPANGSRATLILAVSGGIGDRNVFLTNLRTAMNRLQQDADSRRSDGGYPFTYSILPNDGTCSYQGYGDAYKAAGSSYVKCVNVIQSGGSLQNPGEACYAGNCYFSDQRYGTGYPEMRFQSGYYEAFGCACYKYASPNTIGHEALHLFGMGHHGVTGGTSGNDYCGGCAQTPNNATGAQNSGGGVSYGQPFQPGLIGHWERGNYPRGAWSNTQHPGNGIDNERNLNKWEGDHLKITWGPGQTSTTNRGS